MGADAQDVINHQLAEYDIFLGIMSCRFGSPTKRAHSGTEEEFNRAGFRNICRIRTASEYFSIFGMLP
ncbi:MAG: hypothetical protein DMF37_02915 [Verrucomicrobia bacterium]|nr:MAG: hypothetical protein DMF37_02915 [Verrucomicrobiota bacterium]